MNDAILITQPHPIIGGFFIALAGASSFLGFWFLGMKGDPYRGIPLILLTFVLAHIGISFLLVGHWTVLGTLDSWRHLVVRDLPMVVVGPAQAGDAEPCALGEICRIGTPLRGIGGFLGYSQAMGFVLTATSPLE